MQRDEIGIHKDRGFLPNPDPLRTLTIDDTLGVQQLANDVPRLFREGKVQSTLRDLPPADYSDVPVGPNLSLLLTDYSYLASAYVYAGGDHEKPADHIPAGVAVPLVQLAQMVERPPILSYVSYCLTNWQRVDPTGPIDLENIRLRQHFLDVPDEDWFVLVHVAIEAKAGKVIGAIKQSFGAKSEETVWRALDDINYGMKDVNLTLARMPEGCREEVYHRLVRPYIFSFNKVRYIGVGTDEGTVMSFRGETGAQSSIIPSVDAALGIHHEKGNQLMDHLAVMRGYMPREHARFIATAEAEQETLRSAVVRMDNADMRRKYNDCVEEVAWFRKKHLQYAGDYIESRVADPLGTGGTPFMRWLGNLYEETKMHILK